MQGLTAAEAAEGHDGERQRGRQVLQGGHQGGLRQRGEAGGGVAQVVEAEDVTHRQTGEGPVLDRLSPRWRLAASPLDRGPGGAGQPLRRGGRQHGVVPQREHEVGVVPEQLGDEQARPEDGAQPPGRLGRLPERAGAAERCGRRPTCAARAVPGPGPGCRPANRAGVAAAAP